jgi:hypothetical protein
MKDWLVRFKWFIVFTVLVTAVLLLFPGENARTVAACSYVMLGPALFILSVVDVVRHVNARAARGDPLSGMEVAAAVPLRGLVALFGIACVVIGGTVCIVLLATSHSGALPLLVSVFLAFFAFSRVSWARQAFSYGGELVRVALGKEREVLPHADDEARRRDPAWQCGSGERHSIGSRWVGSLLLPPHGEVRLLLCGTRSEPHAASFSLAQALPARYPSLRPDIEESLATHYEGYLDAHERGKLRSESFPLIDASAQVWSHVHVDEILIEPLDGILTIEIVFTSDWDSEHRLGARIRNWRLVELNGSV